MSNFLWSASQSLNAKTQQDATLMELIDITSHGWPDRLKELPTSLRPYWSFRDELTVDNGITMKGPRVVVPMYKYILAKLHEGHQGIKTIL